MIRAWNPTPPLESVNRSPPAEERVHATISAPLTTACRTSFLARDSWSLPLWIYTWWNWDALEILYCMAVIKIRRLYMMCIACASESAGRLIEGSCTSLHGNAKLFSAYPFAWVLLKDLSHEWCLETSTKPKSNSTALYCLTVAC